MKILITGGVKSGKSLHAEKLTLVLAKGIKPVYLATNELNDSTKFTGKFILLISKFE